MWAKAPAWVWGGIHLATDMYRKTGGNFAKLSSVESIDYVGELMLRNATLMHSC